MAIEPKTGLTFWPVGALQPDLLFNALLLWIAVWAQPYVLGVEDDPPSTPNNGDMYLVGVGTGDWADHDDQVAYWDDVAEIWTFLVPSIGYEIRDLDSGDLLIYDAGWTVATGGLADAPSDGTTYGRKDGAWEPTVAVQVLVPICIACSDETTELTTGTAKVTFRMPYAMTLLSGAAGVRASLTAAQSAGSVLTVDINEGGSSILSTKLTIDNGEKTSTTAATPAVISDTSLADDAEITIDIDQVGTPLAKGLKVWLIGYAS